MIGREKEVQKLKELYNSGEAEFVAIYGRRRVGKTYLVSETFAGKMAFHHAGLSPVELEESNGGTPLRKQLKHFYNSLLLHGMKKSRCPDNWLDAFLMLEMFLQEKDDGKRQVVFLDELPWMDTQKSGFLTAFEGFWNTWGCFRKNLMVIICGSATTWIKNKLIDNNGGLYGRLTDEIKLSPFSLKECKSYIESKHVKLSEYDIVQTYMIMGGIPFYLKHLDRGKSLAQSVDNMFFVKDAPLKNEYNRLFASVFRNPDKMKTIIECLGKKNAGYTRQEISKLTGIAAGGTLSDDLEALMASDFIIKYKPFGMGARDECYKLVDPFCMFYLKFVKDKSSLDGSFWLENLTSQTIISWRGFAFENVCFNHVDQIKKALGISGVNTSQSLWSKRADDADGTQIDMIIERADNVVNLCEAKFYINEFVVNKEYHRSLINRQGLLENEISTGKVIHNTLITTYGLKYSEYSTFFDNVITMTALFDC